MCFWLAKTRKKLELFALHTCLWPGAQMCFRQKWRKLVRLLFNFIVLMGIVASFSGMVFFQLCFRFLIVFFSYCTLTETFAIGFRNRFEHDCVFLEFLVGLFLISSTSYLQGLNFALLAHWLSFFDDINFFRCLVWEVFWFVLWKCWYSFIIGVCNIN